MTEPSLLSNELLRHLVAVGHVDILVGVPTLNNASTIANIVRAVQAGFSTYFPRQRTVLINSDGGSEDNTPAIVRDCCFDEAGTLTMSHGLRTTHRITTPYHGLPGKGNALRLLFAVADLLQARAVAVLDPEVTSLTPEWVAALIRPVIERQFDFVAPLHPRHPLDGPLVTQLVRPLIRASYGWRVQEPLIGEFGCSGRFAAHCLEQRVWETGLARDGIDLWIAGTALAGGFACCQAPLGPRLLAPGRARPGLSDLFQQVVGSAFDCLETHASYWLSRNSSEPLPTTGPEPDHRRVGAPASDGRRLAESFSRDVRDLHSILGTILSPDTLAAVRATSEVDSVNLRYPDELWVATVYEFLIAHHRAVMRREHITQALVPLYVGRTASFLLEHAASEPEAVEAGIEALSQQFERSKAYVVERWNQTA